MLVGPWSGEVELLAHSKNLNHLNIWGLANAAIFVSKMKALFIETRTRILNLGAAGLKAIIVNYAKRAADVVWLDGVRIKG